MAEQTYLAIDLGAESGRGILGHFDGDALTLSEVGRFSTSRGQADMGADGVRRWNFEGIWTQTQNLLSQALARGALAGVGVCSWGVDYGLLDKNGALLAPPIHYRETSHLPAYEAALRRVSRENIWAATGIQFMPINTLYQLLAVQKRDPELLDNAAHFLMISDLLHHRLTQGAALGVERTNGSTTQMLNPQTGQWAIEILTRLGLPSHFLGGLVSAGTRLGQTREGISVYAPATHDTASAVAAVPAAPGTNWAFLSSGTWSLLGAELPDPNLSLDALKLEFSNEGGVGGTTRFLKNIMGLWLVQECRRSLEQSAGTEYSYADLTALAQSAAPNGPLVDATHPRLLAPSDMAQEIRAACRETGQIEPADVGALIRCCLESLAFAYRRSLRGLEQLLGQHFDTLHIVGGGSQNRVLNQWTADACGVSVVAGPGEATAIGNVLGQMVAAGAVSGWAEARELCRRSFPTEVFSPAPHAADEWAEREGRLG